jgi:hypothetical protein
MQRWSKYGERDTKLGTEGDSKFIGVDMARDRGLLAPGLVARAENKRCRDGVYRTRPGTIEPDDFNVAFTGQILGSHIYSNPNGEEVMLVAASGSTYVWLLQYGKDPIQINLQGGQTFVGVTSVEFCQAFEKVLMFRRPIVGDGTLVWDGVVGNTFDNVTTGGPNTVIPDTANGETFQNRVLLYNSQWPTVPWRDQIIMSDVPITPNTRPLTATFGLMPANRIGSRGSGLITRARL